jgi:dimethylargininase
VPRFDRAIVRPPAASFAQGITSSGLGPPALARALVQHADYCAALEAAGLALVRLAPDASHPDSTFVEDTAVATERGVVLARPGAPSRRGETASIALACERLGIACAAIEPPGTLDGGDVCEADGDFLVGISERTNGEGARQLAAILAGWGYSAATIDVRPVPRLLHLKTGLSDLGDGRLAAIAPLLVHPALANFDLVPVDDDEAYAANCVRVNDRVLVAAGCPKFAARLAALGLALVPLEMSEYRKMDGGLSCLSLRLPAGLSAR